MIETGGLAILFAWLIFGGLLCVLAFVVLRASDRGGSATVGVDNPPKSEDGQA
jgi:hypothetical protein